MINSIHDIQSIWNQKDIFFDLKDCSPDLIKSLN